jgi:hypothetical protein
MPDVPCVQAARAPGNAPATANPYYYAIEDTPVLPRQGQIPPDSGPLRVTPAIQWPYHLPSFNGIDCFFWSLLARASYWTDQTWINNVAAWSGPVLRIAFVPCQNPAVQGYALVELSDCVLIVIPGTSSDAEVVQYVCTHSLENITTDGPGQWSINTAWFLRGESVRLSYMAWPPPNPAKPLIIVGHSSGGAYAGYAAFKLLQGGPAAIAAVTFGAPIWGTPSLIGYIDTHKKPQVIEFQNPNDPISVLPPPWSVIDVFQLGYRIAPRPEYDRLGAVLILGNNGRPTVSAGNFSTNVAANAMLAVVVGGNAGTPHLTATYTENANLWAENDPTLTTGDWDNEYSHLFTVYQAMIAAGA